MPTYPEQSTVTGSNLPSAPESKTSISGYALERLGWSKSGFTWEKNGNCITYDGSIWLLNGQKIQYVNDIHC